MTNCYRSGWKDPTSSCRVGEGELEEEEEDRENEDRENEDSDDKQLQTVNEHDKTVEKLDRSSILQYINLKKMMKHKSSQPMVQTRRHSTKNEW